VTDLVALGEMMLCLSAPKHQRLRRAQALAVRVCGAQFNVAANFASLGRTARFLSALPDGEVGALARTLALSYGVDMAWVAARPGGRMGLIFLEYGAGLRPPVHIYDRAGSAASLLRADDVDWDGALAGARLAYLDGIFPALNAGTRDAAFAFVAAARRAGARVCFDVNYRHSLWEGGDAPAFYRAVLPQVDVLVTGQNFSAQVLGFAGSDAEVMARYAAEFGCAVVCLTARGQPAPGLGSWRAWAGAGGALHAGREFTFPDLDRFGTGDAFFAGFLHAWLDAGDVRAALDFGSALCALAHTIDGDPATFSSEEVVAALAAEPAQLQR
jgi:2-dehydro-3-deoxygluconokinase